MSGDATARWVASATPDALRAKLVEYDAAAGRWSGRDNETISRLRAALRSELDRRGEPHVLTEGETT